MNSGTSNTFHPDGHSTSIRANTSMLGSDMLSLEVMSHFSIPCHLTQRGKNNEYKEWIQWLMQHPEQLRPQERQERTMKIGNVDVTFVHGDILDHLDWLESINASLVLRRNLLTKCLERNPYLIKNSVNLQPRWDINPIPNLRWSGVDATDNLSSKVIRLSKTSVLATISHSDALQENLVNEILSISSNITKIIIFHLDTEDYELR